MNKILLITGIMLLTACNYNPKQQRVVDQCLRQQLFQECLKSLPAGPISTHYNDWDEVVSQCASEAYGESIKAKQYVDPKCALDVI